MQVKGDPLSYRAIKKGGGEQNEFSAECNGCETKSKMEINEMYSNCQDSYRPMIQGFRQFKHSLVQLVLKKNGWKYQGTS